MCVGCHYASNKNSSCAHLFEDTFFKAPSEGFFGCLALMAKSARWSTPRIRLHYYFADFQYLSNQIAVFFCISEVIVVHHFRPFSPLPSDTTTPSQPLIAPRLPTTSTAIWMDVRFSTVEPSSTCAQAPFLNCKCRTSSFLCGKERLPGVRPGRHGVQRL